MKMGDREMIGNGSNGNGRQSKKPKPKKVPQRGLGVAQLEKIRLEEEVNIDAVNLSSLAVTPHPSAIPFPRNCRPYPFSNDNLHGHIPCNPYMSPRHLNIGTVSTPPPNNAGAGNNLLSSTYSQEAESTKLSQNPNPLFEPMIMSPFGVLPRGNQQLSSFSSSMLNDAAENSSSTVLSSPTEPPSNQSPYGTYRSIFLPDEADKTAGMKRPCPFSLQDNSDTLLHCKINTSTFGSLEKSTPWSNSGSLVIKGNPTVRDDGICIPLSKSTSNLQYSKDNKTRNRTSDGGFLQLASPATMSLFPNSKTKRALSYPHTHQAELLKHYPTSSNVNTLNLDSQGQQQSFYMFFPDTNIAPDGQSPVMNSRHRNDRDDECLDLNLKL